MGVLREFLPRQSYGVIGVYREGRLSAQVAAVSLDDADGLFLLFAGAHEFLAGDAVTVQLDSRIDVAHLSEQLPVYRTSYKGEVTSASADALEIRPLQFQVFYSDKLVGEYQAPGYTFPADNRPLVALEESPHECGLQLVAGDAETSLGVLFTRAVDRPHSTVMAFLSAGRGDVFLVTNTRTFKAHNLFRDPRAVFAVDYRETYDLAKPLTWAYRLLPMKAYRISEDRDLHGEVREAFLKKNPWNVNFFTASGAFLLHLAPVKGTERPAAKSAEAPGAAIRPRAR